MIMTLPQDAIDQFMEIIGEYGFDSVYELTLNENGEVISVRFDFTNKKGQ